jgi:hypothetical protein
MKAHVQRQIGSYLQRISDDAACTMLGFVAKEFHNQLKCHYLH